MRVVVVVVVVEGLPNFVVEVGEGFVAVVVVMVAVEVWFGRVGKGEGWIVDVD